MVYPSSARTHLQAFSPISRSDLTNITKTKTKTKNFTRVSLVWVVLIVVLAGMVSVRIMFNYVMFTHAYYIRLIVP